MKKRYLFPLIAVGGFTGIGILGNIMISNDISQCNSGDTAACDSIMELHSSSADKITNKDYLDKLAALQKKEAEAKAKADAEVAAALEKEEAERKKAADKRRAEEAAFKAEGWFQLSPGIYGRWCTQTCSKAGVIGDSAYWLLEVWAKERSAGDIYARINVMQNGTVVGWTNDTSYLSKGQKGVMTFTKYLPGSGSNYKAQLTEFNARQ